MFQLALGFHNFCINPDLLDFRRHSLVKTCLETGQAQQISAPCTLESIDELAMTIEVLQVTNVDQSVCSSQKALWNDELANDHATPAFLDDQTSYRNLDIATQQPSFPSPPFCVLYIDQ